VTKHKQRASKHYIIAVLTCNIYTLNPQILSLSI